MTASCDPLVDLLRDSNLLSREQYAHLTRELAPTFRDPDRLSAHLVKVGWITEYQMERLRGDRWRELFLGDYFLWDLIGEGGMGQVFRARGIVDRREVAMKVISADKLEDGLALKRFHREARVAAKLNHPNVVRLIETGQDGPRHYIVMEYVEGRDLQHIVESEGPLSVPVACRYIREAAEALQHAHSQGVVHRDIKPSNVLIAGRTRTDPGTAKILDLGLARRLAAEPGGPLERGDGPKSSQQTALTRFGAVVGTADYMAPEQAVDSSSVDHRADIYSLGCTLYFLLAGQPVFPEGTPIEKLLKHQMDEPADIRKHRPDVGPELARLIHQMLAKRPANRMASGAEVSRGLQRFAEAGRAAAARPDTRQYKSAPTLKMSVADIAFDPEPPPAHPVPEAAPAPRRGGLGVILGIGGAALALAAALAAFALNN